MLELADPLPPRYPIDDILSIVNPDIRKPFDMREVLLRIVDDSRLSEFKPKYGTNMLTAWAHILGRHMGRHFAGRRMDARDQTNLLDRIPRRNRRQPDTHH